MSQGYNGFLPGCPHKSVVRNNHEQATVHAEQMRCVIVLKRGVSCAESIAYVTHYPNILFVRGFFLAAGIKEIKYLHDYKNDELVKVFADQLKVPL